MIPSTSLRFALIALALLCCAPRGVAQSFVVFGYNDLGMHCMDADYSEMSILPPFNTFRAQVLQRGDNPDIIDHDVTLEYFVASNTRSADKTNFWTFAPALLGVNLPPDVGLAGNGLRGQLQPTADRQWQATGVPIVPIDDSGLVNPYPIATLIVRGEHGELARTQAVMPVSQELNCVLCHQQPGVSTETVILRDHDRLHGTQLEQQKPVLCASCHADVALGLPGVPGVPNLSSAMHTAHADRMFAAPLANVCYACHPGIRTQCQRDVHLANGVQCVNCHGDMTAVGSPTRQPWVDQPRCGTCHARPGFTFEEPGKLFKDSRGHGGVHCAACHGSPHAITPTVTAVDNLQALAKQGHTGMINTCTVCHTVTPSEPFPHRFDD